jgi:molybdopterin/thiamine biosynthesis adenylyltransferase
MTATLVLTGDIEAELVASLANPLETAGVLLAREVSTPSGEKLLARSMHWVREDAYLERSPRHMLIASTGYVWALGLAEADGSVPIWFHTHPEEGAGPSPSPWDHQVDEEIAEPFRLRSGSETYATLIIAPSAVRYTFSGTIQRSGEAIRPIDRLWVSGDNWRLKHAADRTILAPDPAFDRNIRAFGPEMQTLLGDLQVAIVGTGGTGSAVAEQLVRLGVRKLLLIDADCLSGSNVTRVYGSTPADVGRPKVEVLRDHLMRIAPQLHCDVIAKMGTLKSVVRSMSAADVVFGCTDDNAGRLVLSRLSTFFLLPVIDVGVLLSSDGNGLLKGIDGRITTLIPGSACLVCRNRVDVARASAELKTPEERRRLAEEGYAPALGQVEPAVVAFTTAVAAAAVNELLDRLIGYGPPDRPTETLLRLHEREMSTNRAEPRDHHYCHKSQGKWGAGDEEPYLGQLWPAE